MVEIPVHKGSVQLLETIEEVKGYFKKLDTSLPLTFDWETVGLSYDSDVLVISFYQQFTDPIVIPFNLYFSKGLSVYEVVDILNEELPHFQLLGHNLKFDTMINKSVGVRDEAVRLLADTIIMVHCYDPDLKKNLEDRVKEDFGYSKKPFKDIIGKKWEKVDWSKEGDDLLIALAGYAGEDTYWTFKLYQKYKPLLGDALWKVHNKIEMPLIPILRDAKIRGVKIDTDLLDSMAESAGANIEEILTEVYEMCGCVFNLNSSKQKGEVFFDKLGMPVLKTTKAGGRSTDSDTMEQLATMGYPVALKMLEYSELQKLYSGYLLSIPQMVDGNNVLRGDLNALGTATGRFSSSNPNLQNQPNNDRYPVRSAFVPRPGYLFINYDFSQIELRIMAHMSKDKHFMEVFRNGEDPHGDVAKRLGISRKGAKTINFGILYGMGPAKLAHTLDISEAEAARLIQHDYMNTYVGFAEWKEKTERFAEKNGYVQTLFGRVRRLPDAKLGHRDRKAYYGALRRAVNMVIQGTAADLMKLCMIEMVRQFKEQRLDAHLLMTVHDEVLVEASPADVFKAESIILNVMENYIKFDVPICADGKIIKNWGEMKDDEAVSVPYRMEYPLIMGVL